MTDKPNMGTCESCNRSFPYQLVHNGFNDTAYAYCDTCGMTALFGGWDDENRPKEINLTIHTVISPKSEHYLSDCPCGGKFKSGASPRCPHCHKPLSPEIAKQWIEENALGTAKGWRWQCCWTETYAVIIDNKVVNNNWKEN